jgi:hypothetical protein
MDSTYKYLDASGRAGDNTKLCLISYFIRNFAGNIALSGQGKIAPVSKHHVIEG